MLITEKLRKLANSQNMTKIVTVCGAAGLLLIMLSSLLPERKKSEGGNKADISNLSAEYQIKTEKRLESFLEKIDGAGEVSVYLTVSSGERYVYAAENRLSKAESRTEEEKKYVIIGNGNEKKALVETVEIPEISGAVIACEGCDSPVVQERIYKAASAALNIQTNRIYVTKLG